MAGDIVAYFGLNDKEFQRGVAKAAAAAGSLSAKVNLVGGDITKSFTKAAFGVQHIGMASFAAVGTAVVLAGKAVTDYGEVNSQVAGELARLGSVGKSIWGDIGRDISGSLPMIRDWAGTVVSAFAKARNAAVDFLAREFRGLIGSDEAHVADVVAAQKGQEQQDAETKIKALIAKAGNDRSAAMGDSIPAQMAAIEQEYEKAAAELNKQFDVGGSLAAASSQTKTAAYAAFDQIRQAKKNALLDEKLGRDAAEQDRIDQEQQRAIAEQGRQSDREAAEAKEKQNAEILLGFETRRLEIDTLRLSGAEKEADLDEARLDAYQRIYEINRQTSLDEQAKADAVAAINRNLAAKEASLGTDTAAGVVGGPQGSLALGLAGVRGLSSQVFGSGAGDQVSKQTRLQERMVRVLESIERKTAQPVAVFGQ